MNIKGIIFDLDGTLLDTIDDIGTAMNLVLKRASYLTHPISAYKNFVGEGVRKLVERALPLDKRLPEIIDDFVTQMKDEYAKHINNKTELYSGIADMLNALTERHIKMAILSNKPHQLTLETVDSYLSKWHFEAILGAREGHRVKPHPDSALELLQVMNINADECLYLGDTRTDMLTAQSALLFPVGALWGFRDSEELLLGGAMYLLETPMELLDLLE